MYKSIRTIRIIISLVAMVLPAWALLAGHESIFGNMQILTALISGSLVCLIFWVVATLVYGRIYCSTVCPLGTTMDCVSGISRLVRRRSRDYRFRPAVPGMRPLFLLVAVLLILFGGAVVPTYIDPYTAYACMIEEFLVRPFGGAADGVRFTLTSFAIASATALLTVSLSWRRGRLLCNTVCPVGTTLGFVARKSLFHPDIDTDKCINCGECERVCKSECIKLTEHTIDYSRCVVCFDCMAVCPNDAITYRMGRHRLGMPMMQATGGRQNMETRETPQTQKSVKE